MTLRFDAEVSSDLYESGLDAPAAEKPGDDLLWGALDAGALQGLDRRVRLLLISDQNPADRHGRQTVVAEAIWSSRALPPYQRSTC